MFDLDSVPPEPADSPDEDLYTLGVVNLRLRFIEHDYALLPEGMPKTALSCVNLLKTRPESGLDVQKSRSVCLYTDHGVALATVTSLEEGGAADIQVTVWDL
ncbi:hypothetical protein [Streptomyces geranii]|uniref:hypothetical protein n=1 Tax=Streptomyces geranii TaxID=2058923 RepID=UPI000D034155|nr:hypothetical protein [Streptomyces geranii]